MSKNAEVAWGIAISLLVLALLGLALYGALTAVGACP